MDGSDKSGNTRMLTILSARKCQKYRVKSRARSALPEHFPYRLFFRGRIIVLKNLGADSYHHAYVIEVSVINSQSML